MCQSPPMALKKLCENEQFHEAMFACSYEALIELFVKKRRGRTSQDTLPLKGQCHEKSCSPEALGRWIGPKPLTAHGFYIFLISCSVPTIF